MLNQIGIIRRCEQSFVRSQLEAFHLHPIDAVTLRTLKRLKLCNQETLCTAMNFDKGRIAKTMARLEGQNLICRIVNQQNKREKLIELTDQGKDMADKIDTVFDGWNKICFTGFSPEEMKQYAEFLNRIAENAAAYRREEKQLG